MIWRQRRVAAALLFAGLFVPLSARAVPLAISAVSGSGEGELARREVDLRAGEDMRFTVPHALRGADGQSLDLSLGVFVQAESAGEVTVSLHGIVSVAGEGRRLDYTSRTFTLGRGDDASFIMRPEPGVPPIEFRVRHVALPDRRGTDELEVVRMSATVWVREGDGAEARVLERKSVRLRGPQPTRLVLESPAGLRAERLILTLTPRARDEEGALLDLRIEAEGEAVPRGVSRQETLRLGWDDRVQVAGMAGPRGPLVVEIKPER